MGVYEGNESCNIGKLLDVHLSDSDNDVDNHKNEYQNRNLKKFIYKLSGKHNPIELRKEPHHNLLNIKPGGKVSLGDLIPNDCKDAELLETKNKLSKEALLEKPMFKGDHEKIIRKVVYEEAIKVTSEWEHTVNKNREAKQMKFPLSQFDMLSTMNTKPASKEQKPSSKLEQEVAKMLKESSRGPLSQQEEKALLSHLDNNSLQNISLKEAQEKRSEFLYQKALVAYHAAKMKRQNKIKSKKYHRIQKKARLKQEGQKLEVLKDKDPEAYQEWLLKEEKKRIEERMTLKHKGTSKHMKKQILYGKFNAESRQAVNDMLEKGRELTQKQVDHHSDDEENCGSDDDLSEDDKKESISNESGLKRHLDGNDLLYEGKMSIKVKKTKMDSTDVLESAPFQACDELLVDDKDILAEFKEEKTSVEERDKVKDVNLFMEGWGSWAGKGIKVPKKKIKRFIIKAPDAPPRKDHKLNHVIISELKDDAVAKHQVDALPWKFNNVHEFQESIRKPVGKQWNKEDQYRQKIKPKVVIRSGSVIEPINKSEALKNYGNKNTDKRNKK